jgi:arsenate reductase
LLESNLPVPKVTIYHNPRCTKSRQTLTLLRDNEIEPEIVEYLKTPLNQEEIQQLLKKLKLSAVDLIRKKEHKALELPDTEDSDTLIARMAEFPQIIERPIVVCGRKAKLGRPPEQVLDIL